MNNRNIFFILVLLVLFVSCSITRNPTKIKSYALVETTAGNFIIGFYEGTPQHKTNFIKNINEHFYDSTLIYSVIPNGLMRAGLPLGSNENEFMTYNAKDSIVENEYNAKLINKYGAVGMLRLPDETNPEKRSDSKLFYFCQGIKTDEKTLHTLEAKKNAPLIAEYISVLLQETSNKIYKDSLDYYKSNKLQTEWNRLYLKLTDIVIPKIEEDGKYLYKMSKFQIDTYTDYGGAPTYDGQYCVFGEIVYGIEILQKLSKTKTGLYNKPKKDILITSVSLISKRELKKLDLSY